MRTKNLILLAAAFAVLAACGQPASSPDSSAADKTTGQITDPTNPPTETQTQPEFLPTAAQLPEITDAAGEDGFDCRIGSTTVARRAGDSLYRSVDETGQGLEILTVDWVSYARYTGELETDASEERRAIVEKLHGNWGTWGQPDTITLEELPATPSGCLEWVGFDWANATNTRLDDPTTVRFDVTGDGYFSETYGDNVAGTVTFNGTTADNMRLVAADGTEIAYILLGAEAGTQALGQASIGGKPGYVDISQEEYFALVGG